MKTRKINKNDDDISASKGNNLDSRNEDKSVGKTGQSLPTLANLTLLQKKIKCNEK